MPHRSAHLPLRRQKRKTSRNSAKEIINRFGEDSGVIKKRLVSKNSAACKSEVSGFTSVAVRDSFVENQFESSPGGLFKACNRIPVGILLNSFRNEIQEGVLGSVFEPVNMGLKPSVPNITDEKEIDRQHDKFGKRASPESVDLRNFQEPIKPRYSEQSTAVHTTSKCERHHSKAASSRFKTVQESMTESGFIFSSKNCSKRLPSFQFFAMSEEGIELTVDLNSRPSDWINSLRSEVSIFQKEHKIPRHSSTDLKEGDEHMKHCSVSNISTEQGNVTEASPDCSNPSPSSVLGKSCFTETHKKSIEVNDANPESDQVERGSSQVEDCRPYLDFNQHRLLATELLRGKLRIQPASADEKPGTEQCLSAFDVEMEISSPHIR